MGLTNKEKQALTSYNRKNCGPVWTVEELKKFKEAVREFNATPKVLFDLQIFPTKSYRQIRDKISDIRGLV